MTFSPEQVEQILSIIDFQHTVFIANDLGTDVLTNSDKLLLKKHGVDYNKLYKEFTPFQQSYYFGKLSAALGDINTKDIKYNQFLQYLRRGQYEPLNEREKQALDFVKRQSYSHIKGLGDKIRHDVDRIIIEEDSKKRIQYQNIIRDAAKRTIIERNSIKNMILEIGNKTNDWGRDLGRIADTEMQRAFETGRAEEIRKQYGDEAKVYKEVFPLACRHCIRVYLTDGVGSEPRVFKLNTLIANGNNIGVKPNEYKATIDPLHPFCRCILRYLPEDKIFNKEKKRFIDKPYTPIVPRKNKVVVTVGDKIYYV